LELNAVIILSLLFEKVTKGVGKSNN